LGGNSRQSEQILLTPSANIEVSRRTSGWLLDNENPKGSKLTTLFPRTLPWEIGCFSAICPQDPGGKGFVTMLQHLGTRQVESNYRASPTAKHYLDREHPGRLPLFSKNEVRVGLHYFYL